ncbi:hypothetical protein COPEUT_02757 [Coprococcus eutactus ATCC 27759]|jgi:hypothetical protein|nr:hypothetical protein COPEUT_02757 [Coprococcus eutactus ATCC 27759]
MHNRKQFKGGRVMDKNYHVSGSQMDGESFKQKDDDQSEKDEKSEKGEKSFHTFISFEGCGHVIFATDDVFTSNADVGVDAWIWDKLYAA